MPLAGQLARCLTCRNQFRLPGGATAPTARVVATVPVVSAEPTSSPASLGAYAVTNSLAAYAIPSSPAPSVAPTLPVQVPQMPGPRLGFITDGRFQAPVGASLRESVARPSTPAAAFPAFPAFEPIERPDPAALSVLPPPVPREAVPAQLLGLPEAPVAQDVPVLGPQIEMPSAVPPLTEKRRVEPSADGQETDEDNEDDNAPIKAVARFAPAWMLSGLVHAVALVMLGMWVVVVSPTLEPMLVEMGFRDKKGEQLDTTTSFTAPVELPEDAPAMVDNPVSLEEAFAAPQNFSVPAPGEMAMVTAPTIGMALSGRGDGTRKNMVAKYGGSEESETAVSLGLQWLKEHQNTNGSWSFRHTHCPKCNGKCRNPGGINSDTGATGLALLPFLGAGQSHREGKYQETVRKGLYYLAGKVRVRNPANKLKFGGEEDEAQDGDLQSAQGNMYCHGLAAIALCEAYGLTRDEGLKVPAQKSLDFIVYAQDPEGGGWRYRPRERGDTSAFGWQLMALKSGHMSYLKVPPVTIEKAVKFLDSVEQDGGAYYGYTTGGNNPSTNAIGLLSRMYLGWKRDNPALERGIAFLSEKGPAPNDIYRENDMYYNYYATQVMHHFGGDPWKKWNAKMRDQVVESQGKSGHEKGSWWSNHHWTAAGGRLYETALSVMTLEVYYRHMPIYKDDSVANEFGVAPKK